MAGYKNAVGMASLGVSYPTPDHMTSVTAITAFCDVPSRAEKIMSKKGRGAQAERDFMTRKVLQNCATANSRCRPRFMHLGVD